MLSRSSMKQISKSIAAILFFLVSVVAHKREHAPLNILSKSSELHRLLPVPNDPGSKTILKFVKGRISTQHDKKQFSHPDGISPPVANDRKLIGSKHQVSTNLNTSKKLLCKRIVICAGRRYGLPSPLCIPFYGCIKKQNDLLDEPPCKQKFYRRGKYICFRSNCCSMITYCRC